MEKNWFFLTLNIFCWLNVLWLIYLFATEGDLGCLGFALRVRELWIKLLLTSVSWLLVGPKFSVSLYKYQQTWQLYGLRKGLCLSETAKLSFKVSLPLCLLTSNEQETQLLHILAWFGGVGVLGFDHFNRSTRAISLHFGLQPSDAAWCCALFYTLSD